MKWYLRPVLSTTLISVVINLLMLTGPLFMLQVYDRVLTSASVQTLSVLIILVGALYIFMAALDWIRARVMSRLARRWDEDLAPQLFKSILADGDGPAPSARVFPPLRDLDIVRNFLSGPGPLCLFDAPWVPIYIGVIFLLHSLLGWFSIFAALLLVSLMLISQWATKDRQAASAGSFERSHAIAQEAQSQADFVTAIALYDGLSNAWDKHHSLGLSQQQRNSDRANFFSAVTKAARLFLQAGILALGAWLAIRQELSPGSIVATAIILSRGLAPIEQLIAQWRSFSAALAAWQRLKRVGPAPRRSVSRTTLPAPLGRLSVNRLACFIPGVPEPLLANLNFHLDPGDSLGIIGPSGVGKSTLLKAVLGTWPIVQGEIRLDGATLDQWNRSDLANHLGYVPQDVALFTGTVAQNISRFQPDASSELIVEAARLANAHDMIVRFPRGYDTVLGPKGAQLSAGQRQRVALACAFYRQPRLIVLDEPNSNLDEAGDKALSEAIKAMRAKGSTIILASHKMAAVAEMAKVLVLRDGRQIAFAPKDEISTRASELKFPVIRGVARLCI